LAEALVRSGNASLLLRVRQGEAAAVARALARLDDRATPPDERLSLARVFGEVTRAEAEPVLLQLAIGGDDPGLRKAALGALSAYNSSIIGVEVAARYTRLPPELRAAAQGLLTSRPAWSLDLLKLVQDGNLAADQMTADAVARLRRHEEESVARLTSRYFPRTDAEAAADPRPEIKRIEAALRSGTGNPYAGETLFDQRCGICHRLFHKGAPIGPDLTPYQRDDLGTLLPSILDPDAEIREGFENYSLRTRDGRSLSGFLADRDANVVILRGFDAQDIAVRRDDILELKPAAMSLMPKGLLEGLSDAQLRDLFAYLRIPQPISR
jgi:putative heme-binding domain-containing protein